MPGLIDRNNNIKDDNIFSKSLKKLIRLGMFYEDMVLKQSKAIGATESTLMTSQTYFPPDLLYSIALADIGQKKYIGYFDKSLKQRREELRRFALNSEIDFILETIADEAIVYDSKNFFCTPYLDNIKTLLNEDKRDEILDYIWDSFKRIYYLFRFSESHDAWLYFKQFLIDGFLAFEIIWDKNNENIIGFKELDPLSLRPGIENENGKLVKVWYQYEETPSIKRKLYDSQIIYISYAKSNFSSRVSYVERLIRSFNLLRILENSRIIWNIMNSQFRMKMVVPIGTKSPQKARESLAEILASYKEDIYLDNQSGELFINGRPSIQFYKNYLFPSKDGQSPEIESIRFEGPDLSDTEALKYFYNKLKQDSCVPFSRFDRENNINWTSEASSMTREEIRFSRFINRLRSIFQEILLKPLLLQICAKYPELNDDPLFKSALGIKFEEDNVFKEAKQMEIMQKRVDFVNAMLQLQITVKDSQGMDYTYSFFDPLFLAEKYLGMSEEELRINSKYVTNRQRGLDPKTGKKVQIGIEQNTEENPENQSSNNEISI